ncbi:hypothetical protein QBC37DRAFT_93067 [Rhypophila decipiens]|uniref:DUF7580 domain-containing protein n=1 Tax=Rhypophila decipiens TaxID=261697 RepID=A0AAN6XV67_9PEZI|nr:hypothetical protein QBC37DRAFT_93067 [Rhypophila decipiens]
MAEVAGLVLGGIPLAIWVLEKYAEPFEAFHRYHTSITTFKTDLILQNRQLHTTLSNIGLDNHPSIQELQQCFSTKFPTICDALLFIVQRMDETTSELLKSLEVGPETDSGADAVRRGWRRVKHSLTTKRRAKVIEDLRHWNEEFRRAVEKAEVPAEDDSRKVQDLVRRFNMQRCNSIRRDLNRLHQALESGFQCACSPAHCGAINLDWRAIESDTDRTFQLAFSYQQESESAQGVYSWRKLRTTLQRPVESATPAPASSALLPSPERSPSPTRSLRSKITNKLKRSFSHTPPLSPPPLLSTSTSNSTFLSPHNIALLMSEVTTTPISREINCLCTDLGRDQDPWTLDGFLKAPGNNDPDGRFHFSHMQTSCDSQQSLDILSVKSLVCSQPAPRRNPFLALSAGQRFGIAASIAWAVLHLGGSSWFTDCWDQTQVGVFIEKTASGREFLSQYPWASCDFSRTGRRAAPSNSSNVNNLIPNRTVYAVGLLLIELCTNKPFDATEESSFEHYHSALERLDEVYRLAGNSYGYAAERCVKFSFMGRDQYNDFEFSTFRQQFYESVVAPVQATYLKFKLGDVEH